MLDTRLRRPFACGGPAFAGLLLALACLLARPGVVRAQWPAPNIGLPVCTAIGTQSYQTAISDGAGGMFVAWSDTRFILSDIYVQHVSASGAILWRVDGTLGCGAANRQNQPVLVSDGAGGIVIAWRDFRYDTDGDIFAQRIGPTGTALWTANGVAVCLDIAQQTTPVITMDSGGGSPMGFVIAWEDDRAAPRIYAQRLDAAGTALWAPDGVPATTSFAAEFEPTIVPAGPFGVIVAWSQQGGTSYDIYAQNLGHEGQPLWDPAGHPICTAAGNQYRPTAVSDSASGAWFTWQDDRAASVAVYAQRVALPGFFVLDSQNEVAFDAARRGTKFDRKCGECGRFNVVAGAFPVFLVDAAPLPDVVWRTDVEFGTGDEQHPLILVGPMLARRLNDAKLSGVDLRPVVDDSP